MKCDRCSKEFDSDSPERVNLRALRREKGKTDSHAYNLCSRCMGAVTTVIMTPTFEMPEAVGPHSIMWSGERWERMRETTPVPPPPGFEDHPALQSLTHPDELPADRLLAPSPTGIVPPPVIATTQRPEARGVSEPGRRGAPQSFTPHEDKREDKWQPGDKACDVHNCPYRAVEGTTRCRDHVASAFVPITGAGPMAPKIEGRG